MRTRSPIETAPRGITAVASRAEPRSRYRSLTDPESLAAAWKPETKAIWVETPTNPLLKVIDLAAVAEFARAKKLVSIVDNTFATPIFQRPFEYGRQDGSPAAFGTQTVPYSGVVTQRPCGDSAAWNRSIVGVSAAGPCPSGICSMAGGAAGAAPAS